MNHQPQSINQKPVESTRLPSVQALRAVAALLVVGFHICVTEEKLFGSSMLGAFRYGMAGVDIFFVISGFIITYISYAHLGERRYAGTFLLRRVQRIYPVYWEFSLCALALCALGWLKLKPGTSGELLSTLLLLPQEHYRLPLPGWTLVYEMFFYTVFLLFFLLPRRMFLPLLGLWAAYILLQLDTSLLPNDAKSSYSAVLRSPYCLHFILGCMAGLAVCHGWQRYAGRLLGLGMLGFAVAQGYLLLWEAPEKIMLWARVPLFAVPSALVVYGLAARSYGAPRWLNALGDASYSLYLVHTLVMYSVGRAVALAAGQGLVWQVGFITVVAAGSITLALLNYRYIEKPLLRWAHSRRISRAGGVSV